MAAVEEVVEIVSLSEIKEKVVLVVKEAQRVVLQEEEAAILAEDQADQTDQTDLVEALAIEFQAVSEEDVKTNSYKIKYSKTHL